MKQIPLLLILIGCLPVFCRAQFVPLDGQAYIDSLQNKLLQPLNDSILARTNYALSDYWSAKDSLKATSYLSKGQLLSGNIPLLNAIYYYYKAGILFEKNITRSQSMYLKADSLLNNLKSEEAYYFRAKTWNNYALLEQYKDDKEAYLRLMLNKALPMAKLSKRNDEYGLVCTNVGLVFMNAKDFKKADQYLTTGLRALKSGPHYSNSTLAYCYSMNIKNKILTDRFHEAGQMLDSLYDIISPYPNNEYFLDYYQYSGMYYREIKDFPTSIQYLDKSIDLADKLDAPYQKHTAQFQKYKTYTAQGHYMAAKKALLVSMNYRGLSFASNRLIYFYELAKTSERLGAYKTAYQWLEKYAHLQDSVHEVNTSAELDKLEIKYRTSEKEKQILSLQAKNNASALKAQGRLYTNRLLTLACIFLGLIILTAIFYYRRNNQQKELNHKQQVKDLKQQQQLKVTQAMLDGEERERVRVARDLHDGLGGMLAGVKLNLSGWANDHADVPQDKDLGKVIDQLDNSVSELRRIARNMIPETLLNFGLEQALRDLVSFYVKEGLSIDFQPFNIQKDIPIPTQLNIYRIAQELLSNAVKHASATGIVLQCSQNEKNFLITVEDNGQGFDPDKLASVKGIGLHNLKSRVAFMNAKLELISSLGEGTTVNIEIPLNGK